MKTVAATSQCSTCRHLRPWFLAGDGETSCAAYPDGIPSDLWDNVVDHRRPAPGDQDIRWESLGGEPYPDDGSGRRGWVRRRPRTDSKSYLKQPRDPGGEDGGQWVAGPASGIVGGTSEFLASVLHQAGERDDPRAELAALRVPELKALATHAGLDTKGLKADLVGRLVAHVTGAPAPKAAAAKAAPRRPAAKATAPTKGKPGGTLADKVVDPAEYRAAVREALVDPEGSLFGPPTGDMNAEWNKVHGAVLNGRMTPREGADELDARAEFHQGYVADLRSGFDANTSAADRDRADDIDRGIESQRAFAKFLREYGSQQPAAPIAAALEAGASWRDRLKEAKSTDEAAAMLKGLSMAELRKVGDELSIAPRRTKADQLNAIVEGTVGARLAHEAIVGGKWNAGAADIFRRDPGDEGATPALAAAKFPRAPRAPKAKATPSVASVMPKAPARPKALKPADLIGADLHTILVAARVGAPHTEQARDVLDEARDEFANGAPLGDVADQLREGIDRLVGDVRFVEDMRLIEDPRDAPRDRTANELEAMFDDDVARLGRLADALDAVEKAASRKPRKKAPPRAEAAAELTGHVARDAAARSGWKQGDSLTHKRRGQVTYIEPDERDASGNGGGEGGAHWVQFEDGETGMVSGEMLSGYVPAKATEGGDGDESSVREAGRDALGEVPADRVPADGGPGGVLPEVRGDDSGGDLDSGGLEGGGRDTGRELPGAGRPAEYGAGGSDLGGAPGDVAGGRGGPDGVGADAPIFRPRGQEDLAPGTSAQRRDANLEALRTLRRIQSEGRPATAEEQRVLARYSGWGSIKDVFKPNPPNGKDREARRELEGTADTPGLLSPEEFEDARRGVQYAHYTDADYVKSMWQAMEGLGFDGGRVLEPGSGTGNFMGFAPSTAKMVGVEVDPVTASIAALLYPNHTVRRESFADTPVREGDYDAAVGNVPFSGTKFFDPVHNPGGRHSMHNHFIIKSLRGTRPGGLVAMLTSRHTLDATTMTSRREMAKLGDLVGAVRLPSDAHKRAAGTAVVTDLLIFRRRAEGVKPAGLPFAKTVNVDVEDAQIPINEVFVNNPHLVLGEYELGGMRAREDLKVVGDASGLPDVLNGIVERAKADGLTGTAREIPLAPLPDAGGRSTRRPDGYARAHPDGTFTQIVDGREEPYDVPKAQAEELRALFDIRDTLDRLLDVESSNDEVTPEMDQLRQRLNGAYDNYVRRHGWINRFNESGTGRKKPDGTPIMARRYPPTLLRFNEDPSAATVQALESYDEKTNTATKGDIFRKRVVEPRRPKETADGPDDALAITMDARGYVDLDHVAKLLRTDREDARRQLGDRVFADPAHDGELVLRAEYLSGDVREKLAVARRAAADDPAYNANAEALESALPADLKAEDIHGQLGSTWIPPADVQQFLSEILNDETVKVSNDYGTTWKVTSKRGDTIEATSQWGLEEFTAIDMAQHLLSQKPIKVYDTFHVGGKERKRLNRVKTEAGLAKAQEMNERFADWIWQDPDRAERLAKAYNETFNGYVVRSYDEDGKRLTLPGKSILFTPHDHVKAAVARVLAEPSVGLWHEVGAGKTAEMVISAMELKRLGLVNKPTIVVPNHMLNQMRDEFIEIYPKAKLLAASSDDLSGDKRRRFIAKAATNDWDAVILTRGAFERIPVSAETQETYLRKEMREMEQSLERAKAQAQQAKEGGDKNASKVADRTIARMEKMKESAENKIKTNIAKAAKDPSITFERTGIDYLFIDEAHYYKNLRRFSSREGMGHAGNGLTTDLATKLDFLRSRLKTDVRALATPISDDAGDWANPVSGQDYRDYAQSWLDRGQSPRVVADKLMESATHLRNNADDGLAQERHGTDEVGMEAKARRLERLSDRLRGVRPGRALTLSTATPIANAMGEAHTMLRYLRPDLLESMRLDEFDRFVANFGQVKAAVEPAPEGGMRIKERISRFINIADLQMLWWIPGDVKNANALFGPPGSERRRQLMIPEIKGGQPEIVVVPGSEELKAKVAELGSRAKAIRERRRAPEPGDDIMLNITAEGRAAALDLRLVGRETDEPGKLDVAADRIHGIWERTRDNRYRVKPKDPDSPEHPTPGALQIVFADIGTPKNASALARKARLKAAKAEELAEELGDDDIGGDEDEVPDMSSALADFDAYDELRRKLHDKGIPLDQIKFIHEARTDRDRAKMFDDARSGRIAVLIGSTEKMGTGTNVQTRAVALHHLDVPWRPADLQQREGRIVRQKNQNPEVEVIRYVTEGSFDTYNWGIIARKAGFINQMMGERTTNRISDEIGDMELSAGTAMALAAGRPELVEHNRAQTEMEQLERLERSHEANLRNLRARITAAERQTVESRKLMESTASALAHRDANRTDAFTMRVIGSGWMDDPSDYDNRAEANAALVDRVDRSGGSFREVGKFQGFDIYARRDYSSRLYHVDLRDPSGAVVPGSAFNVTQSSLDKSDLVAKLQNKLRALEEVRDRHQRIIDEQQDRIVKAEAGLRQPFKSADALRVARAKFAELDEAVRQMAEEATKQAEMDGPEGDAARALLAVVGENTEAPPVDPAKVANEMKARLNRGEGFRDLDDLRAYIKGGSNDVAGGVTTSFLRERKAELTPGGRLLVHNDGRTWRITEPRTMRGLPMEFPSRQGATLVATGLENTPGLLWNADPKTRPPAREWRTPEGFTLTDVVNRIRAANPDLLDPDGVYADLVGMRDREEGRVVFAGPRVGAADARSILDALTFTR